MSKETYQLVSHGKLLVHNDEAFDRDFEDHLRVLCMCVCVCVCVCMHGVACGWLKACAAQHLGDGKGRKFSSLSLSFPLHSLPRKMGGEGRGFYI